LQSLVSAGMLPIKTVGDPGIQGAAVAGTQGMGVSTPRAAAVAAATVGLEGELHMPKGKMLTSGALSMMVAAGGPPASTRFVGSTIKLLGATPKLHCIMAPMQTWIPIRHLQHLYLAANLRE
jgi:hypothetical protein